MTLTLMATPCGQTEWRIKWSVTHLLAVTWTFSGACLIIRNGFSFQPIGLVYDWNYSFLEAMGPETALLSAVMITCQGRWQPLHLLKGHVLKNSSQYSRPVQLTQRRLGNSRHRQNVVRKYLLKQCSVIRGYTRYVFHKLWDVVEMSSVELVGVSGKDMIWSGIWSEEAWVFYVTCKRAFLLFLPEQYIRSDRFRQGPPLLDTLEYNINMKYIS